MGRQGLEPWTLGLKVGKQLRTTPESDKHVEAFIKVQGRTLPLILLGAIHSSLNGVETIGIDSLPSSEKPRG